MKSVFETFVFTTIIAILIAIYEWFLYFGFYKTEYWSFMKMCIIGNVVTFVFGGLLLLLNVLSWKTYNKEMAE